MVRNTSLKLVCSGISFSIAFRVVGRAILRPPFGVHARPPLRWFAQQVVWQLGRMLDDHFVAKVEPPKVRPVAPIVDLITPRKVAPKEPSGLVEEQDGGAEHWRARKQKLFRYFMAGRAAFDVDRRTEWNDFGAGVSQSVAIDASRVSKRKVNLVLLAREDNTAMWAPPQAPQRALNSAWLLRTPFRARRKCLGKYRGAVQGMP